MLKWAVFFGIVTVTTSANFPEYFKKCNSKSGLNECIKDNIVKNLDSIVTKGDKSMKLSSLNPMKLKHMDLQASPDLKIVLDDIEFKAFDTTKMKDVEMDFDKKSLKMEFNYGRVELIGKYDIKGKILVLPISGNGRINLTGIDADAVYKAKLDTIDKDGQKYYNAVQEPLTLHPKRVYFELSNLFNGDERLGTEMNKFLNENWKDVYEEVKDVVMVTIASLTTVIVNAYLNNIPISDLVD